jgi:hypothetical protein
VAPSVFVDDIGQRNTANWTEPAHRESDRQQGIGMDARRQPERGLGFLVEVQIPASSESPQIEGLFENTGWSRVGRLGLCLQYHVERRLSGSSYVPKTTSADDLTQLRLASLRPERSADLLRQ